MFRWIDSGVFMMGSLEAEGGDLDREDYHQVTLTQGFWIAETSVTQALWESVMDDNPSYFKGDNRPVETVSWHDCHVFLKKLNMFHPELKVRLLWEAEWEFACRAGTHTSYSFGEDITLEQANYRGVWNLNHTKDMDTQWADKAKQQTTEVKHYAPNDWGLYEMHGNIWEWCQDSWQQSLGVAPITDPRNGNSKEEKATRVVRGGAWSYPGANLRSACRTHSLQASRDKVIGFRLALVSRQI